MKAAARSIVAAWGSAALLAGCAGTRELPPAPVAVPPTWYAERPASTTPAADLARWWAQFDDPLLSRLVEAAQRASPTIASAASRIEQARATRAAATAALLPALDASVSASRGRQDASLPVGNSRSAGLQASWELDVFGRNRAGRDAAAARLMGADASWHDARISVAVETANAYIALRACEARLAQSRLDADSRAETARLTDLSTRAGFESRANAALARAGASQARVVVRQQAEQCEQDVKAVVELTAVPEPELRALAAPASARLPQPAAIDVPGVPAAALAQRPDVFARGREIVAASAEIAQADAARLPRITLAGNIGYARSESELGSFSGTVWNIGPVSVSLPVFDAGARRANAVAARARYDEALSVYAGTLRTAVREVEDALVTLAGTADRSSDAQLAADNFEAYTRATEARYKSGFGTLFELEDARRSALAAQNTLIDLRRERVAAWIALYRALGGGWAGADANVSAVASNGPATSSPP